MGPHDAPYHDGKNVPYNLQNAFDIQNMNNINHRRDLATETSNKLNTDSAADKEIAFIE